MEELKILPVQTQEYESYSDALADMILQGVKHLGWVNGGVKIPDGAYREVYSNRSGTSCLYVDLSTRIAYSVDMGD